MEDMVEGGDEGDPETATPTLDSSLSLPSTVGAESVGAVVVEDEKETHGSDSTTGTSGDPWARVKELPTSLRDKMLQLRNDK